VKPIFIQACPSDLYFIFQTQVQLHNYRKLGYSDSYRVLIFVAGHRPEGESTGLDLSKWYELNEKFPEAKFYYYYDNDNILNKVIRPIGYIPLLRLFCLQKHFEQFPELKDEVIFYHDADILLTKKFPFGDYMGGDTCYLSNTQGYLGIGYLDSKIEHALPDKKEDLISLSPVDKLAECAGITRGIIEKNDSGTGGAQYLLKNIDADFWKDCYETCIRMKMLFNSLLPYFENGNKSYQGFCSDMWAVLYNLWKRGQKTETPSSLDFAWGTDKYDKLKDVYIYHNAGITKKVMDMNGENVVMFFKGLYANNDASPFLDKEYLKIVSPVYANKFYADELLEVEDPVLP